MSECLQYVFCCLFLQKNQTRGRSQRQSSSNPKKKKEKHQPKSSRIVSKYKLQEIVQISKEQKRNGKLAYTCPICTLLFNKILACDQCENNMCCSCVQSYEKRFQVTTLNMKCPFCNSETSRFIDYEQEAKSYFDTTGKNGFLDASQRKKIDEEMKWNQSKKLQNAENHGSRELQRIEEQSALENVNPTLTILEGEERPINGGVRNSGNVDEDSMAQFRYSDAGLTDNHNPQLHGTV